MAFTQVIIYRTTALHVKRIVSEADLCLQLYTTEQVKRFARNGAVIMGKVKIVSNLTPFFHLFFWNYRCKKQTNNYRYLFKEVVPLKVNWMLIIIQSLFSIAMYAKMVVFLCFHLNFLWQWFRNVKEEWGLGARITNAVGRKLSIMSPPNNTLALNYW